MQTQKEVQGNNLFLEETSVSIGTLHHPHGASTL